MKKKIKTVLMMLVVVPFFLAPGLAWGIDDDPNPDPTPPTGITPTCASTYVFWLDDIAAGYSLGAATTGCISCTGGIYKKYAYGDVFYNAQGVRAVSGAVRTRYWAEGGPTGWMGFPKTSTRNVSKNSTTGYYNDFASGSIYYSGLGTFVVLGSIRTKFYQLGGVPGLGFPTSNELAVTNGRVSHFQYASIYCNFKPGGRTCAVVGSIRTYYNSLGASNGRLGFPVSDENQTPHGALSIFEGASVFYHWQEGLREFSRGVMMIDGRITTDAFDSISAAAEKGAAVSIATYINDDIYIQEQFRINVASAALAEVWYYGPFCGPDGADRYGAATDSSKFCSEFVRWCYLRAGWDKPWYRRFDTTDDYKDYFTDEGTWLSRGSVKPWQLQVGDFLAKSDLGHSMMCVGVKYDNSIVYIADASGSPQCSSVHTHSLFSLSGIMDAYFAGRGGLKESMFD